MSFNKNSDEMIRDRNNRGSDTKSPPSAVQSIQARKSFRRSAIFRKEVPVAPAIDDENVYVPEILRSSSPIISEDHESDFKSSCSTQCSQDRGEGRRISVAEYMKALQTEKEEWSLTRRARSDRYRQLLKQNKSRNFESITIESCAYLLSDEDKKFMSQRPEYVKIANNANALREDVTVALGLKHMMLLGANTVASNMNKKIGAIDWEVANED